MHRNQVTAEPRRPLDPGVYLNEGRFGVERHVAGPMDIAHWHDHIEINLLISGSMTYLFNGRHIELNTGRIALFWAAIPHRTVSAGEDAVLICVYLPLQQMLDLPLDRHSLQSVMQGSFLTGALPDAQDPQLMSRWVDDWDSGDPVRQQLVADEVRLRVRRLLLSPLGAQPIGHTRKSRLGRDRQRLAETLVQLINLHFDDDLSLTRLANMAQAHQSTASAAFRSVMGITVHEYLIRYRLTRAMHRLADTDDPILDIAFSTGFGSSSRFYEVFKNRIGQTPRQFRERMRPE